MIFRADLHCVLIAVWIIVIGCSALLLGGLILLAGGKFLWDSYRKKLTEVSAMIQPMERKYEPQIEPWFKATKIARRSKRLGVGAVYIIGGPTLIVLGLTKLLVSLLCLGLRLSYLTLPIYT